MTWRGVLWLLLVASIVLNLAFFSWQRGMWHIHAPPAVGGLYAPPAVGATVGPSSSTAAAVEPSRASSLDTDGDGIPDQHDFCPGSARENWLSGRATDFDQDGCADGAEDQDKDNDGIPDMHDRCPFTPQKYSFVSNTASDFDADGCADGVEDTDDDNDTIPNSLDACPLTSAGELSDGDGCSQLQRETLPVTPTTAHGKQQPDSRPLQAAPEQLSRLERWTSSVSSAGLEVLLGAILSAMLGKALLVTRSLSQKLPPSPTEGIRGRLQHVSGGSQPSSPAGENQSAASWGPHILRIVVYIAVVSLVLYSGVFSGSWDVPEWLTTRKRYRPHPSRPVSKD